MDQVGWNISGNIGNSDYGYVENSNLLASVSVNGNFQTAYTYEDHRNLKTSIQNTFAPQIISQYDYEYDELGRRTSVVNTGLAFASQEAFNQYVYNDRNEVTESSRFMGTDPDNITQPVEPEKRIYEYDPIGNRNSATEGAESKSYAANSLNQYEEVTAGGSTVSLSYDEDGNLTAYNGVNYTYNAENRLIAVEPATPVDGDTKVENTYDYMGRRVKKTVYDYSADSWNLEKELLFVYDGWNLIEEITVVGASETSRYFVWGLDLSQSLQGAGGIGGLLATVDGSDTYYFAYDGNGNVGQVIDASTSTIAASYQYDPFGNLIKADGAYADENPYRFSTKYFDTETELYYYVYRYYSVELGRWINKDPIGEAAFFNNYIANKQIDEILNLINEGLLPPYLMVNNNTIHNVDYLGLCPKNTCDRWKLTIVSTGTFGDTQAGMIIGAELEADDDCCMDNYENSYFYYGAGIGGGAGFSFSLNVDGYGEWFDTSCISWEDHEGIGKATSSAAGFYYHWGALWVTTPQVYLYYEGWGRGFDLSAVTTIGNWALGNDTRRPK